MAAAGTLHDAFIVELRDPYDAERQLTKALAKIVGIIEEGKSIVDAGFDGTTMGACLIAAGRCAERYGMAAYGTLAGWADAMPQRDAGKLFRETLDEEKRRRNRARIWR